MRPRSAEFGQKTVHNCELEQGVFLGEKDSNEEEEEKESIENSMNYAEGSDQEEDFMTEVLNEVT